MNHAAINQASYPHEFKSYFKSYSSSKECIVCKDKYQNMSTYEFLEMPELYMHKHYKTMCIKEIWQ